MNYTQLLRNALQLSRTTKLVWVFGSLSLLSSLPGSSFQYVRDNPTLACIYFLVPLVCWIITLIGMGGLYYLIYQTSLSRAIAFSEAWSQGKSRLFRNIGVGSLSIPILLIEIFLLWLISGRAPTSPFLWLIFLPTTLFISSFIVFGFCAVMIDNARVLAAAKTSFLITINNFFRVFVITSATFLARLLITVLAATILASGFFGVELPTPLALDYQTYQKIVAIPVISWINWIFNLFLFPIESIMLTFAYLQFTKEVPHPALVEKQTTA